MSYPLYIAFLWHMHQPYYKDPFTGIYRLPWVRLHGTKDYLDMVRILQDFPDIRQTFNLVPSLLEQLKDYVENNATDRHLELTLKEPQHLTEHEKLFILENFFLANWDNMIKPFPRYYELLVKRGLRFAKIDGARISRYFTISDIRDIQTLFNLSWIDPMFRDKDSFLKELIKKERNFTEEEKHLVIKKQFEILKEIIPAYKEMNEKKQIEVSVSPFYHPILPLLMDTNSAKIAMPHINLPKNRFSHPEDAIKQIKLAIEYFEGIFGVKPAGMWPSEGSVSKDIVRAIGKEGIQWIATDEEVLSRSIERPLRNHEGYLIDAKSLYSPYKFSDVSIIFRDHKLSDLIGFVYSGWKPEKAVEDFIGKFIHIKNSLPEDRAYLVPIILDGENCWEHYKNDGHDFLRTLYSALSNDSRFKTVTISEFIREHGNGETIQSLHAGSWINANFSIWIGHEEDNLAWDYLAKTREDLELFSKAHSDRDLTNAWKALYAAEGSDWNWWYGDEHTTKTQQDFDELFRGYLMRVYKEMGRDIPPYLYIPILQEDRSIVPAAQSRGFIYPKIDGFVTGYFEWYQSAYFDVKKSGGSMHKSESLIDALYYGFNKDSLFIRLDLTSPFAETHERIIIRINIIHLFTFRITFDSLENADKAAMDEKVFDEWIFVTHVNSVAKDIFEIEIPFKDIKVTENDEVHFSIDIIKNGDEVERCPWRGYVSVTVPSPDYEMLMWH
jgi:alpha-amylase/alpha-mannosidase (GH57 family)